MTFYDKFTTQIQCEESNPISDAEYNEVMMLMATEEGEDFEGYAEWSQSLEPDPVKDWLNGYKPITEGATYNGIDI